MTVLLPVMVLGVLLLAGATLYALILSDRQRRQAQARLARAAGARTETAPEAAPRRSAPKGRLLVRLDRKLSRAGIETPVQRMLMPLSMVVLGCYVAALVLGLHPLGALVLAVALPGLGALALLSRARSKYCAAFTTGLPEALDVFARGLRAGRPVADSLSIVVENAEGPIRREFTRARDEMLLGTTLSDTLARLNARMPTAEVSFFAVATVLQAETGGNLIETMENLAEQLRDRRKLRRKARALTSEARASAGILAALPFAVGLLLAVLNTRYLSPLWSDPRGQVMTALALLSIGCGIALMLRMGKLHV